jgi:hypothetical protein
MNYWVDLYDAETWRESCAYGLSLSGFTEKSRRRAERIEPGDVLLGYVIKEKRSVGQWVGALEVMGRSGDTTPVWKKDPYPVRFAVRSIIALRLEQGVPQTQLDDRRNPFCASTARHQLEGMVRRSPNRFTHIDDAKALLAALKVAAR